MVKCREGGRTVNVCVVHAVGVNRDGFRESLGLDVVTAEDGVSSDAHPGLVDAIAATLPGAGWQRCRTHFMRNLLTRVPKSAQSFVATMVRTIFAATAQSRAGAAVLPGSGVGGNASSLDRRQAAPSSSSRRTW